MDISFELSQEDYILANRIYSRQIKKSGKIFIWLYRILGSLIMLYALFMLYNIVPLLKDYFNQVWKYLLLVILELLFGASLLYVSQKFPDFISKKMSKRRENQQAFLSRTMHFDENGIQTTNGTGENSFVKWESISSFYETGDYFLMEMIEGQMVIVPKNGLSAGEEKELSEIVAKFYPNAINYLNF